VLIRDSFSEQCIYPRAAVWSKTDLISACSSQKAKEWILEAVRAMRKSLELVHMKMQAGAIV
jgi:hypothetical protein